MEFKWDCHKDINKNPFMGGSISLTALLKWRFSWNLTGLVEEGSKNFSRWEKLISRADSHPKIDEKCCWFINESCCVFFDPVSRLSSHLEGFSQSKVIFLADSTYKCPIFSWFLSAVFNKAISFKNVFQAAFNMTQYWWMIVLSLNTFQY